MTLKDLVRIKKYGEIGSTPTALEWYERLNVYKYTNIEHYNRVLIFIYLFPNLVDKYAPSMLDEVLKEKHTRLDTEKIDKATLSIRINGKTYPNLELCEVFSFFGYPYPENQP